MDLLQIFLSLVTRKKHICFDNLVDLVRESRDGTTTRKILFSTCNSIGKVEIEYTSIHIVAAKIMSRFQRTTYYQHIFFLRFECISLWRS